MTEEEFIEDEEEEGVEMRTEKAVGDVGEKNISSPSLKTILILSLPKRTPQSFPA